MAPQRFELDRSNDYLVATEIASPPAVELGAVSREEPAGKFVDRLYKSSVTFHRSPDARGPLFAINSHHLE